MVRGKGEVHDTAARGFWEVAGGVLGYKREWRSSAKYSRVHEGRSQDIWLPTTRPRSLERTPRSHVARPSLGACLVGVYATKSMRRQPSVWRAEGAPTPCIDSRFLGASI